MDKDPPSACLTPLYPHISALPSSFVTFPGRFWNSACIHLFGQKIYLLILDCLHLLLSSFSAFSHVLFFGMTCRICFFFLQTLLFIQIIVSFRPRLAHWGLIQYIPPAALTHILHLSYIGGLSYLSRHTWPEMHKIYVLSSKSFSLSRPATRSLWHSPSHNSSSPHLLPMFICNIGCSPIQFLGSFWALTVVEREMLLVQVLAIAGKLHLT